MWNTCGSFWKCISNVTFRLQRTLKNRQLLLKKVKIVTLTHEVRYVDNMVPNWDSNILAAKDTRMKQVVSRETKNVKSEKIHVQCTWIIAKVLHQDSNILAAKDTRMKQVVSRETKNVKSEKIHVQCTWITAKVLHQDSNILAAKDTRMKQVVSRETKNVKSGKTFMYNVHESQRKSCIKTPTFWAARCNFWKVGLSLGFSNKNR
jgi:hypothetical protein